MRSVRAALCVIMHPWFLGRPQKCILNPMLDPAVAAVMGRWWCAGLMEAITISQKECFEAALTFAKQVQSTLLDVGSPTPCVGFGVGRTACDAASLAGGAATRCSPALGISAVGQ